MESKFSLTLGKLFGIRISLHWTFSFLILWVIILSVNRGLEFHQILIYILFVLTLFLCIVLHELGHSLAAIKLGGKVKSITLLPIGGMANISEMPEKPRDEFLVSAAGPLVNIIIAGFLWLYLTVLSSIDLRKMEYDVITANNFLVVLMAANLFIVAFNLIPAFPLDGGRLFRSALSVRMNRLKATQIAKNIGQIFAIGFILAGFFINPFLIVIGIFIFLGAKGEYELLKYQKILDNYTVRDIVKTDYEKLDENESFGKAAERLLHISINGFVITSGGEYKGILTKKDIIEGLASRGKEGKIKEFIKENAEKVSPDMSLFDVFKKMQINRYDIISVSENDKFIGILDSESINEFVMIQNAIR